MVQRLLVLMAQISGLVLLQTPSAMRRYHYLA
jgi:hypothetical protein